MRVAGDGPQAGPSAGRQGAGSAARTRGGGGQRCSEALGGPRRLPLGEQLAGSGPPPDSAPPGPRLRRRALAFLGRGASQKPSALGSVTGPASLPHPPPPTPLTEKFRGPQAPARAQQVPLTPRLSATVSPRACQRPAS